MTSIVCVGLTAFESDKVRRVAEGLRGLADPPPVACHAVGPPDGRRALCFILADGRITACVASDVFLAAADVAAVRELTVWRP